MLKAVVKRYTKYTYYISRELWMTRDVYWSSTSVCLSLAAFPHYCTDLDVTWGMVGVPLVVHYWADLQLVHVLLL